MHSIAGRSSIAGTTLRAQFALYAIASRTIVVREVGLTNTTSTAFAVALVRLTAAGTQGSGLTEAPWNTEGPAQNGTGFAGHTGDATVGGVLRQASIGAAVGSGIVWTFGGSGLRIPAGTANGIGTIIPTGTGQIVDYWLDWEEEA
jgi:hypothetical protein